MEAVKQGSACVGLKSNKLVVLATLKRASSELAEPQPKVFKVRSRSCSFICNSINSHNTKIDAHIGIGVSGLCADARSLCLYMRNECLVRLLLFFRVETVFF